MMKVLHIYKTYYPFSVGGIEKYIHTLSESLHKRGITSAILTTHKVSNVHVSHFDSSQVFYFPADINIASCPFSFFLLRNFRKITRGFDILHFHFPWPFADLARLFNLIDKPVVVTYHSDIVRQKALKILYYPLMNYFLNQADAIIATSNNYLQSSPVLKRYAEKVTLIPYGLDPDHCPQASSELTEHWRRQVGDNFFLFVGALRYYKGLHFLLEAVANSSIRVVIAGSGFEESKLKQIKIKNKLDNVIFTGAITNHDKAALYQLCRASVSSAHSRAEAFCISLLESLVYGRPMISTELGTGTSFVNTHMVSGLVVPPANSQAIRHAMELLLTDENLYQRLKKGTLSHYQQYFTTSAMCDQHVQVYNSLTC